MRIQPEIVADIPRLTKFLSDSGISFFDFGCSAGGSVKWGEAVFENRGLGFDINEKKLLLAEAAGIFCCNYDILKLADQKFVDQTIIFHMLEHLYSLEEAKAIILKAVAVSREAVGICQPYYDFDAELFHIGLKTYYSHWSGHRNQMTTPDFWHILDQLKESGAIKDFVIGYKKPITSSSDPILHPLSSPKDCHGYDAAIHPLKKMDIELNFPLFYEIQIVVDIAGNGPEPMLKAMAPDRIAWDSRINVRSDAVTHPSFRSTADLRSMVQKPFVLQSTQVQPTQHQEICFFIRDDDFVKITPKFVRLEQIASPKQPIMMAAIPGRLNVTEAEIERIKKKFVVSQHGYLHANHGSSEQRSEFPESRTRELAESDLLAGRIILENLFGDEAGRDFVAPWNRFFEGHLDLIVKAGYKTLHTLGPVSLYDGMPIIGSGINFTSTFVHHKGRYDEMFEDCKARIKRYVAQVAEAYRVDCIYVPINTHHLIMDDRQFDYLGQLCADLEIKEGVRFAGADEALRELKGLGARSAAVAARS